MNAYQGVAYERIRSGLSKARSICNKAKKVNAGEADTRTIVVKVLRDYLGWDELKDITAEERIKGGFADYMLRYEGRPYAVIEIKKISGGLRDCHLEQARNYAVNKGLDWIILTNGDEWQVHRLYFKKKIPETFHVLTVSFCDTALRPAERAELFYLLSKEAVKKDALQSYNDRLKALSPEELTKRLLRKDVIDRIRIGIKNDIGYRISNEDLARRILDVIDEDAKPSNVNYYVKKLGEME